MHTNSHLNSVEMLVIAITQSQGFFLALRKDTPQTKRKRTKPLKAKPAVLPLKTQSSTKCPVFIIINSEQ